MKKIVGIIILVCCHIYCSYAQSIDYESAINEIMERHIDDYPEPTIEAFDKLFSGINVDDLPVETCFKYYYYYGACISDINPESAIKLLSRARTIASSSTQIGLRNAWAIDAESCLADLHMKIGTEEHIAAALLLYNDIVTVGISLLNDSEVAILVVKSLIEQAKMGVGIWKDEEWIKKIWIQARDLALEINDASAYSYYIINVLNYYCDRGEYDYALDLMKDAENKDISQVDIPLYIKSISEIKELFKNRDILKISKGIGSLDYWTNEVEIATRAMALCSQEVANKIATETATGLEQYNLKESYEYSQILHVLTQINHKYPAKVLPYCLKQINIITKTPQFFIYTHEAEAYNLLAVNQMKLKDYKHAEVNYKNALKYLLERDLHYSNSAGYKNLLATIYHNIGRNYYFLQDYQNSIEYLTKSVSIQMELNGSVWPKTERYLYEAKSSLM